MKEITNKSLLFLYCCLSACFCQIDTMFVMAFFGALILAASCSYFSSDRYTLIASILYALSVCLSPTFLCFLPVISYDIFLWRSYLTALALLPALMLHGSSLLLYQFLHLLFGIILAFYLEKLTHEYKNLSDNYKNLRDDSTEKNILLKEKNKTLLENQDYEIYTATLKERNRIAREIHDNVGHMLSRSILLVGALKIINQEEKLAEPLDNLDTTLSLAMTNIRQSVHDLHDDSINLKESAQKLVDEFTFCHAQLYCDMRYNLPRELKYTFLTITKEALVNVSRHSNATRIQISMREHPGFWQLIIEDNGNVPGEIHDSGIGLSNIRERVEMLNGRVEFEKTPGFRIFATFPKTEMEES